ncbi:hypothetical protein E2C01_091255 [Portunus trituberculatus]|uniref:Uncharacterized protein n=1 Tax=Portunus trituberculatus TaxID=210409 RepID=A0A5B7JH18_PORTR|nr:hypothetical protein [Portunus trituberculatus]
MLLTNGVLFQVALTMFGGRQEIWGPCTSPWLCLPLVPAGGPWVRWPRLWNPTRSLLCGPSTVSDSLGKYKD